MVKAVSIAFEQRACVLTVIPLEDTVALDIAFISLQLMDAP